MFLIELSNQYLRFKRLLRSNIIMPIEDIPLAFPVRLLIPVKSWSSETNMNPFLSLSAMFQRENNISCVYIKLYTYLNSFKTTSFYTLSIYLSTYRRTDRQADRQTDRQTDRPMHAHTSFGGEKLKHQILHLKL